MSLMESFNTIAAFAIIVVMIGLSDFISQCTKGYISMLFIASIAFILLFVFGTNKELFELASIGNKTQSIALSLIITHLGTSLNLKTIAEQWKTVIHAIVVQIGILLTLVIIVPFIFDKQTAIASITGCGGGIVSIVIVKEAFESHGLTLLSVFMVLLLSFKSLIGYPVTSFLLRKEGLRLLVLKQSGPQKELELIRNNKAAWPFTPFVRFAKNHNTFDILLAKIAVVTFISFGLSKLTGFTVNPYIICFVCGYIAKEIAFLEPNVLKEANSFGFLMLANLAIIFSVLTMVDLPRLKELWLPLIIIMLIALVAICLFSVLAGRLLGFSIFMSLAAGTSCMFGFPGTFIIPSEVAKSISKSKVEMDYVFNSIFPIMLVAGFANITILSVIIAGILVKFI